MKILILWPIFRPAPTAAAVRGEAFAKYLAERGNQVRVVTPLKPSVFSSDGDPRYSVRRLETYDTLSVKYGFVASSVLGPASVTRLRREIASFQPDIIIASSPAPFLAFEGYLSSRGWRIPFIYDVRDSWRQEEHTHHGRIRNWAKRSIERILCKGSNIVFCVSESLRESIISDYDLPNEKVKLVTNGSEPITLRQDPNEKEFDLVFSGYPAAYRNVRELLMAISIACKELSVRMLCLGWRRSPQEPEILALSMTLGIEKNLDLRFPVSHEKVPGELIRARIGVTSLSGNRSLASAIGTKTYEYLAAGLPVACLAPFPESELKKFIEENRIGFYSRNAQGFARNLVRLLRDGGRLSAMSQNALRVSTRYSWKSIVSKVHDDYLVQLGGLRD